MSFDDDADSDDESNAVRGRCGCDVTRSPNILYRILWPFVGPCAVLNWDLDAESGVQWASDVLYLIWICCFMFWGFLIGQITLLSCLGCDKDAPKFESELAAWNRQFNNDVYLDFLKKYKGDMPKAAFPDQPSNSPYQTHPPNLPPVTKDEKILAKSEYNALVQAREASVAKPQPHCCRTACPDTKLCRCCAENTCCTYYVCLLPWFLIYLVGLYLMFLVWNPKNPGEQTLCHDCLFGAAGQGQKRRRGAGGKGDWEEDDSDDTEE